MTKQGIVNKLPIRPADLDSETKKDVIEMLGALSALCLFMLIIFSIVYIFFPDIISDYPEDLHFGKTINFLLYVIMSLMKNWFSYVLIVIIGSISYFAAQYLESEYELNEELKNEISKKEIAPVKLFTSTPIADIEEVLPNEKTGKPDKNIDEDLSVKGRVASDGSYSATGNFIKYEKVMYPPSPPARTADKTIDTVEMERAAGLLRQHAEKLVPKESKTDSSEVITRMKEASGQRHPAKKSPQELRESLDRLTRERKRQ